MENSSRLVGVNAVLKRFPVRGWLGLIVLLGILWKVIWLSFDAFPFNSDEAITGLMARHILQGERPVFFYGQAYMGSLDAFLIAGLFAIFGESVLAIRVVQTALYTCTIITTASLGRKLTKNWTTAIIATLLLAVPAVNVTLYTTVSLGGYGEALLLSNLAFLTAFYLSDPAPYDTSGYKKDLALIGLLGLITGLGFWVFGLSLTGTLPASLYGFFVFGRRWKLKPLLVFGALLVYMVAFVVGSWPWWHTGLSTGIDIQIKELAGSAVSIEKGSWLVRSATHLFYFVFLGLPAVFGIRPPWEIRWLALPLLPFVLMIWGWVFSRLPQLFKQENGIIKERWIAISGSVIFLAAGFVFTSFGLDPSGRYFLPLAVPFYLLSARVISTSPFRSWQKALIVILLVSFHAIGTIQSANTNPPGITTQFDEITWIDHRFDKELIDFLHTNNETRGYSNYWVAYPLAFLSGEEMLFSPRLPYHSDFRFTSRDDRIPFYTRQAETSSKTAYITTFHPELDDAIRQGFSRLGVSWREKEIGDYQIFYDLSSPVHPASLDVELRERTGTSKP